MYTIGDKIYLSKSILDTMAQFCSAQELSKNKASKIFTIAGKMYLCVGVSSTGANGVNWINVRECVPFSLFKGKTYVYADRIYNKDQSSDSSGNGQLFNFKGNTYVLLEHSKIFYPVLEPEQLTLFN